MNSIHIRRLGVADRELARTTFTMMSHVFEEDAAPLSDDYLDRLLAREDVWAFAALVGGSDTDTVGGLVAHTLPMTRDESSEIFIYDLAVRADHQRGGVGRRLVDALRGAAAKIGITVVFVPADDEDQHALDFYRAIGGSPSPVTFFTFGE